MIEQSDTNISHKSVVRPNMLYGMNKKIEQRMSVAAMRMLRWMSEVTRENNIRNEYIWGSIVPGFGSGQNERNRLK